MDTLIPLFHIREKKDFISTTIQMQTSLVNMLEQFELIKLYEPSSKFSYRYGCGIIYEVEETLEDFVEQDLQNIVELFHVFNDGTHGSAGRYDFQQLAAIKKRVEDGIVFLSEIIEDG